MEQGACNVADPVLDFPEHEKVREVRDKSQAIGNFLDWLLQEKGIRFCEPRESEVTPYLPIHFNIEELLAEFFEIDLGRLEEEKQEMLKMLRKES
jgi:hypothetical protein